MPIFRFLAGLGFLAMVLSGCSTGQPNADAETIAAVSYRDSGPKYLTLFTMVNNRSGSGAHSGIVISAEETILFDPAGSFYLKGVPERNDVLFGITPSVQFAYKSAHARSTFHVVTQTVELTPEQANVAYQLAMNNGAVGQAFCANATSTLISRIPGFEGINVTYYPKKLSDQFGTFPGVKTEQYFEDDSPDLDAALKARNAALAN